MAAEYYHLSVVSQDDARRLSNGIIIDVPNFLSVADTGRIIDLAGNIKGIVVSFSSAAKWEQLLDHSDRFEVFVFKNNSFPGNAAQLFRKPRFVMNVSCLQFENDVSSVSEEVFDSICYFLTHGKNIQKVKMQFKSNQERADIVARLLKRFASCTDIQS